MIRFITILLATLIFHFAAGQNNTLEKLSEVLQKAAVNFPKSKVFLKTDKDIYAPGEKVWFKANVLNCLTEGPSVETDLIMMVKAESGEVIVDNKYFVPNGEVNSQITIPSWAPEGNAYLIAYTPNALMVNEASLAAIKPITINLLKSNDYILELQTDQKVYRPGDEVKLKFQLSSLTPSSKKERMLISLFDYQKELFTERVNLTTNEMHELKFKLPGEVEEGLYFQLQTTGKNHVSQRIPVYTTEDQLRVEFFPEGGHLLLNNIQRIVYRATDPFGKPADISGKIYDQMGNQAGVGKILKPGIGMISLMPMPGQTYFFKVDSKYGNGQKFEMPKAVTNGSSFTLIKMEKDNIKAAIFNTGTVVGQQLTVVAIANGEIKLSLQMEAKQRNNFEIPSNQLPLGMVNFVVLDNKGSVISQRMIFNTPNEDQDIEIETHLSPSKTNGEVEVTIDLSNFIRQFGPCNVDLKIVDKQNLYHSNTDPGFNFLKYPLITTTPKTVLEIYIANIELLANTYRYYSLQDLLDGKNYLEKKEISKNVSGKVTDKSGARIPNATVMAVHANNPTVESTTSDENGWFVFNNLSKTKDLVIKAVNESGKKTYFVHLDHSFDETLEELLLIESFKVKPVYSAEETPAYFQANSNLLKQVGSETRDRKPRAPSSTEQMLQSGSSVLDVIRMIKPFNIVSNQIVFYGTSNSIMNQQGALIVIDGQKMGTSIDALNAVNPFEVASINVSTDPTEIQRYTALNSIGIIEIRTHGSAAGLKNQKERDKEEPTTFARENFPDDVWKYQSTIYWKPNIKADQNGQIKLKLKLSEIRSRFAVVVDMTSSNGITHRQTSEFTTVSE